VAQSRVAGIHYLLSVMALVWVADIGAYFAGRRWGGRWIRRNGGAQNCRSAC
jgi:phosphatidate cytidylyltransferase